MPTFSHEISISPYNLCYEPFTKETKRVHDFDCGAPALNDFLCLDEARKYHKERLGRTTLVFHEGELIAYFTLCNHSLRLEYLTNVRGFSQFSEFSIQEIPSLAVGRLAVQKDWQSKGIGRIILQEVMSKVRYSNDENLVAARLIVVQAKNESVDFYKKAGFEEVFPCNKEKARRLRGTTTMFFDTCVFDAPSGE